MREDEGERGLLRLGERRRGEKEGREGGGEKGEIHVAGRVDPSPQLPSPPTLDKYNKRSIKDHKAMSHFADPVLCRSSGVWRKEI